MDQNVNWWGWCNKLVPCDQKEPKKKNCDDAKKYDKKDKVKENPRKLDEDKQIVLSKVVFKGNVLRFMSFL